jgi:hypothetical protein
VEAARNTGISSIFNILKLGREVMKDSKPSPAKDGLNAEIQSRIGHQLRAMYDDVVRQGVPDRFAELIRKLDASEPGTPHITPTGDLDAKNDGRD